MAKEILENERKLYIPRVEFRPDFKLSQDRGTIADGMMIDIEKVEFDNVNHNLIVYSGGKPLVIEIGKNNPTPDLLDYFIKYFCITSEHYNKRQVSAIRIGIDSNKKSITKDELKTMLLEDSTNKIWLHNMLNEYYSDRILEFTNEIYMDPEKITVKIPVLSCPIHMGKIQNDLPFHNYCYKCKYLQHYCVDDSYAKRDRGKNNPHFTPCGVLCSAQSGIVTIDDLLKILPPEEIPYSPNIILSTPFNSLHDL